MVLNEADLRGSIVAFCNPLLDITAEVSRDFLDKYGLKANDAILAGPEHLSLYDELVREHEVLFTAGGSAQNTARAAQWILPPHSTVFVGCVGRDANAARLREAATADGLQVEYLEDDAAATGTCACLITERGKNRSLVANLGAANNYKITHLLNPRIRERLEEARIIYISGFFLTVSPETILQVARLAHERGKVLCMNLSAPFICQHFLEPLLNALPYVDYLFGNEAEAAAIGQALNLSCTDLPSIARHLASLEKIAPATLERIASATPRIIVITHGAEATHVVTPGEHHSFPVPTVAAHEIVDTNGAGDAFVGGFLSQLVRGRSLKRCVNAGHYTAQVIIRRSGVSFPPDRPTHL